MLMGAEKHNLDTRSPDGQYGGEAVELRQVQVVELLDAGETTSA